VRLESSFGAPASPARAWTLLTDLPVVVPCVPGAELVEQVDETTWTANVKSSSGRARCRSGIRLLARALFARFRRARDATPPPAGEGA
jgi:carbon monoxide dehydrogenase subunit G